MFIVSVIVSHSLLCSHYQDRRGEWITGFSKKNEQVTMWASFPRITNQVKSHVFWLPFQWSFYWAGYPSACLLASVNKACQGVSYCQWELVGITLGTAFLSNIGITKWPVSALWGSSKSFPQKLMHSTSDEIIFLGQFNKILALSFPLIILLEKRKKNWRRPSALGGSSSLMFSLTYRWGLR